MAKNLILEARQRVIDAYERGDMETAKQAAAEYRGRKASLARSKANIAKDQEGYDPTKGMSGIEKLAVGNTSGWANVGRRAGNLAGLVSDEAVEKADELDAPLLRTGAGLAGRMIGEIASTAPVTGGVGAGARAAMLPQMLRSSASAARAGSTLGKLRRGASYAAEGAVGAELTSGEAGEGAGLALALNPALNRLGRAAGWVGRGSHRSKEAEELLDLGADLTPGQLNPHSRMARFEGAAREAPLNVGRGIREAQDSALKPVVPNLAGDVADIGRPTRNLTAREGLARSHQAVQRTLNETNGMALDPAEIRRLRADRGAQAQRVREARRDARVTEDLRHTELTSRSNLAEARALIAEETARRNPSQVNIARAENLRDKATKLADEVTNLSPRDIVRAGNRAGQKANKGFVPEAMKDLHSLVQSSVRAGKIPRTAASIKTIDRLGRNVLRARSTDSIKDAISELKAKSRALKYKSDPTADDFDEARVLDEARGWFESQLERAIKDPQKLARLQRANKQYGELVPLEDATFSAGADPSGLVTGRGIEKAVQGNMTRGGWLDPAKRGRVLSAGEAMRSVEEGSSRNALQQAGLPFMLKLPQSLIGTAGGSKLVRTMAQGRAGFQKPIVKLSKALNSRQSAEYQKLRRAGVPRPLARAMAQRDRYLRSALPGALTDTQEAQ